MVRRDLRVRAILAILVAIMTAAMVFLPPLHPGSLHARKMSCANNLRQLYQLAKVHASSHQGHWPDVKGSALGLEFTKTEPPLIGQDFLELLLGPARGEPKFGACDYLGPRKPVSELGPRDALAGDRPGNHGDPGSGNVLLKDGSVQEYDASDRIWRTLSD